MMGARGLCADKTTVPILDAGMQPISNRYLNKHTEAESLFPLVIGQCQRSGIIYLSTPFPAEELVPRHHWITYNEPEDHLDQMVEMLLGLPGINSTSIVAGISFKDDTTLERFSRRGYKTWRLDMHGDLDIGAQGAGAESVQAALTVRQAERISNRREPADVLLVRHIYEHAYDLVEFTDALKVLVKPSGYVVIEVPDCTRPLDNFDYTTLWEEHLFYFTPYTLTLAVGMCGLSLVGFKSYPYKFEDSLVVIAQVGTLGSMEGMSEPNLQSELDRGSRFGARFEAYRTGFQQYFRDYCDRKGKIALMGGGHLACTFISLFKLQNFIEFVVDDNPHKQGLFMPGSRLPIVASHELVDQNVSMCLLSMNPMSEDRVIAKNSSFLARGGQFRSIFPASGRAIVDELCLS